jgi:hypothetical protein
MRLSDDLKSSKTIYAKGILFLVLAIIAGALLIAQHPTLKTMALLAICVWAACRSYYFAFYVIEKYVDSEFRFSGLIDFVKYLIRK